MAEGLRGKTAGGQLKHPDPNTDTPGDVISHQIVLQSNRHPVWIKADLSISLSSSL